MFRKFADIKDNQERLEIYNLLKFNLSACLRLAELMTLVVLISGLGWFIGAGINTAVSPALGPWVSAGLSVFVMILIPALIRLPFLLATGRLKAAFKLDPRPEVMRVKEIMNIGLRRFAALWGLSMFLYAALTRLDLWQWTLLALAVGGLAVAVDSFFPRLMCPDQLRPLRDDDLDPALMARIDMWKSKTGFSLRDILISSAFRPELSFPKLAGLGPTMRLIIHEKALASFPPRELSILVVTGVMDALVKGPLKFMLLRLSSLMVAVPLASILISAIGAPFWGYPLITTNPVLVVLVWAATWVGLNISDFTIRFTSRSLTVQLAAAAGVVLKDESSLETALATMAKKNLEDGNSSDWREMFRRQYTRPAFLKRVRSHQKEAVWRT